MNFDQDPLLLPAPKSFTRKVGYCRSKSNIEPSFEAFAPRFARVYIRSHLSDTPLDLTIRTTGKKYPHIDDSYAYVIDIDLERVTLVADTEWGAITAFYLLEQLTLSGEALPCCHIEDEPSYPWRGLMIDVARHYIDLEKLLQTIDLMAVFRLNVLHLHLTDDQGFRFESKHFPHLATEPFYRQTDFVKLVEYAADRAIRIVPEIDTPGHATSWLLNYPEWGTHRVGGATNSFGVHDACLDPSSSKVVEDLSLLFDEVCQIFPDDFVHIGGDEVNGKWWNDSKEVQDLMQERDWSSIRDVQAAFSSALVGVLTAKHKKSVGWDEILHSTLAKDVTVQAWRGLKAREHSVNAGHDCIVSSPYYLDLQYPADVHYLYYPDMTAESWISANSQIQDDARLDHVKAGMLWGFDFGSFPDDLDRNQIGRILGGEACMWSELVNSTTLFRRVWSRMPLIAERFWNAKSALPSDNSYQRVAHLFSQLLESKLLSENPLAYETNPQYSSLDCLFQQLEPIKWYGRLLGPERLKARTDGQSEAHLERPYDCSSPLDQLVDHLPPESLTVRNLNKVIRNGEDWSQIQKEWESLPKRLGQCKSALPERLYSTLQPIALALKHLAAISLGKAAPDIKLQEPIGEYILSIASTINDLAFRNITAHWSVNGKITPIGVGKIHETYRIDEQFLLQKINSFVFEHPERLEHNYTAIKPYLGDLGADQIHTTEGALSISGRFGCWRLFRYYLHRNFDSLPEELCESAGTAFGTFLSKFRGIRLDLKPVIPNFHDLSYHLGQFDAKVKSNSLSPEISFVEARREYNGLLSGNLQVIHGDCKVNNLLVHPFKPVVLKVIDLDTVMIGHPAMDYGDLIRSLIGVDDPRSSLSKIRKATQGFLQRFPIAKQEIGTFARAPAFMAFMLGLRYLVDHLDGDVYFKTEKFGENLVRCQERFNLTQQLELLEPELRNILAFETF